MHGVPSRPQGLTRGMRSPPAVSAQELGSGPPAGHPISHQLWGQQRGLPAAPHGAVVSLQGPISLLPIVEAAATPSAEHQKTRGLWRPSRGFSSQPVLPGAAPCPAAGAPLALPSLCRGAPQVRICTPQRSSSKSNWEFYRQKSFFFGEGWVSKYSISRMR